MRPTPTRPLATPAGLVGLVGLVVAACGGEAQPPPQAPPPAAPSLAAVATPAPAIPVEAPPAQKASLAELVPQALKGLEDAFNAHDAKKMAGYCVEDCVVASYGEPEAHGRDAVARGLQRLFDTFGDARSAPTRAWSAGSVVVSEVVWSGTMTGDFMGLKASHKPVGQIGVRVLWFNDEGIVKEIHEYADSAGLMAQMTGKKAAPAVPVLPTNAPEMHVSSGSADDDGLAEWAKGIDEAFSKGDPRSAGASMAEDGDYWLNFGGGPAIKGKKELDKGLVAWFRAFPDQKWTTTKAWGIDGFAIVEHTMSGTQKGPLGPMRTSNKSVADWHWLDILQPTADRTIQHGWGFANLGVMMQQTGAFKQPADKSVIKGAEPAQLAAPTQEKK